MSLPLSYALMAGLVAALVLILTWGARFSSKDVAGIPAVRLNAADWMLLGFMVSLAILSAICVSRELPKYYPADSAQVVFLPTLLIQTLFILVAVLFKKFADAKFRYCVVIDAKTLGMALKFFALAISCVLLCGILINLFSLTFFEEIPESQDIIEVFIGIDSFSVKILAVISIGILAPISEEIVFRGLVYRTLKGIAFFRGTLNAVFAASVSSLLFSAIHANAFVFLPLFIMGMILAASYEKSGSIVVPMLVHSLFNFSNIFLLSLNESVCR